MSPRDSEFEEVYMSRVKNWLPRTTAAFVIGVVLVILLYAAIAYVPAGHVGVLTLFGRVTGEARSGRGEGKFTCCAQPNFGPWAQGGCSPWKSAGTPCGI